MKLYYLFLLLNFESTSLAQLSDDCLRPYCVCSTQENVLICTEFNRFEQLDFSKTNNRQFSAVQLVPKTSQGIDLDESLNLKGLNLNGQLFFANIKSINPFYNPFKVIKLVNNAKFYLEFVNSTLLFTNSKANLNAQQKLIEDDVLINCQYRVELAQYVFSLLKLNEFNLCNTHFVQPLCPIYFKDSTIDKFTIKNPIGKSFGFRQLLYTSSSQFEDYGSILINAFINQLSLVYSAPKSSALYGDLARIVVLDATKVINKDLFFYLKTIDLSGLSFLERIDEDLFAKLRNVKELAFYDINLKRILITSRKWLANVNKNENFDIDRNNLDASFRERIFRLNIYIDNYWSYDDDVGLDNSLCLFKYFPHNQLIYPYLLHSENQLPCSCTIYWLYKYVRKFRVLYQPSENTMPLNCFRHDFDKDIVNCRFDMKFPNCKLIDEELVKTTTKAATTSTTTLKSSLTTSTKISFTTKTTTTTTTTMTTSGSTNIDNQGLLMDEQLLSQSKTNFAIAITLLVLLALVIVALLYLYLKMFTSKSTRVVI